MPAVVALEYAHDVGEYTLHRRNVAKRGPSWMCSAPGQNAEGYGNKITSDMTLKFKGSEREYRVYITCWSNSGTCWITYRGRKLVLRTHFQEEVLD